MESKTYQKIISDLNKQLKYRQSKNLGTAKTQYNIDKVNYLYSLLKKLKDKHIKNNEAIKESVIYNYSKNFKDNNLKSRFRKHPLLNKLLIGFCKENNLYKKHGDTHYCTDLLCLNKPLHKILKGDNITIRHNFCEKHYLEHREINKEKSSQHRTNYKMIAQVRAIEYFNKNFSIENNIDIEVKELIADYYLTNSLSEPFFAILLCDILKFYGGDPIHEYPGWLGRKNNPLKPDIFADILDRKFKIVIEVKAPFFHSASQHKLPIQEKEYKKAFKGYKFYALSPDNYSNQNLRYKTSCLKKFIKLIKRKAQKIA